MSDKMPFHLNKRGRKTYQKYLFGIMLIDRRIYRGKLIDNSYFID